jgi:Recombinase
VRQVWPWMRREGQFPMRRFAYGEIQWAVPTYHQIHRVLESPVYAGAYAFGKTRRERYVDEHGQFASDTSFPRLQTWLAHASKAVSCERPRESTIGAYLVNPGDRLS